MPNSFSVFVDLREHFSAIDDDQWSRMLFKQEPCPIPLPDLPPDDLQRKWCGNAGNNLANQSAAFYRLIKEILVRYGVKPLSETNILDFGCGWGRLTRYWVKDVPPNQIFGCDPDPEILQWCETIPGTFAISDYRPRKLPFNQTFDLVYAYSVFTHLSRVTAWECLQAIHDVLTPCGIAIVTVRPRAFIKERCLGFQNLSIEEADSLTLRFDEGEYIFCPHNLVPIDGEITFGAAAIPYSYIQREWTKLFEFIGKTSFPAASHQVPIILKKRNNL